MAGLVTKPLRDGASAPFNGYFWYDDTAYYAASVRFTVAGVPVSHGAGAVDAGTNRVVHATDDPAVVALTTAVGHLVTSLEKLTAIQTATEDSANAVGEELIGLAPVVPERLGGPNGVIAVPVALSGAGTMTAGDAGDLIAGEAWSLVGWVLTFSDPTTLTTDSATVGPRVLKPKMAGWDLLPGNFALYTGAANEDVTFASSAGDVDGWLFMKKEPAA